MDIIKNRVSKLRVEFNKIDSNRKKLDYLKNYYEGKTAIIVATGPGFAEYKELIKSNLNENTILICIKQSIRTFDMNADFHIINKDHYEKYKYLKTYKPVVLFKGSAKPDINNIRKDGVGLASDIIFYKENLNNVVHEKKNGWDLLNTNIDFITFNDENLGEGENMVVNEGHIVMGVVLPFAIHLGIKNIILNGFVGGSQHGTLVKNEISWDTERYKKNYKEQDFLYESSKNLSKYLKDNFNVNIYSICDTNYHIEKINSEQFKKIISPPN